MIKKLSVVLGVLLGCLMMHAGFSWSEYVRLINNTHQPLQFQFATEKHSGAHPSSGRIRAHHDGPSVQLTDGDWWQSNGLLTISQGEVHCVYRYQGMANKHELTKLNYVSGPAVCRQASVLTKNADHDCNGPHNCVIFNPDQQSVARELAQQREQTAALPLNQERWIGTHNSAVSSHYIDNGIDRLVALNQTLSLTQQLDEGVRSLELDVVWSNNALRICHFHTDSNPDVLCFNNKTLASVLQEVQQWLAAHPKEVVMLYFDINHPLSDNQVIAADQLLQQTFASRLYTVADAYRLPLGPENKKYAQPLPLTQVSMQDLRAQGKQVIVSAKRDFANSPYVFLHVLDDHGIDGYMKLTGDCHANDLAYFNDPGHQQMWRLNGDRSLASGVVKEGDYVTVDDIYRVGQCPINLFSMDQLKLGDARLAAQV